MKKVECFFNLIFYNFNKLDYNFRIVVLGYLNPINWIIGIPKLKYGFTYFKNNFLNEIPSFLNLYKNNRLSKLFFLSLLYILNATIINYLASPLLNLFGNKITFVWITSIVSIILVSFESNIFLFKENKFYNYHKSFENNKHYSQPFLFLIATILLLTLWIYSFRFKI